MADPFVIDPGVQGILDRAETLRQQYDTLVGGINDREATSAAFRADVERIVGEMRAFLDEITREGGLMAQLEACITRVRGAEANVERIYAIIRRILDSEAWNAEGGYVGEGASQARRDALELSGAVEALRNDHARILGLLQAERDRVEALQGRLRAALDLCEEQATEEARLGRELGAGGGIDTTTPGGRAALQSAVQRQQQLPPAGGAAAAAAAAAPPAGPVDDTNMGRMLRGLPARPAAGGGGTYADVARRGGPPLVGVQRPRAGSIGGYRYSPKRTHSRTRRVYKRPSRSKSKSKSKSKGKSTRRRKRKRGSRSPTKRRTRSR